MDVFDLRDRLVSDYATYTTSFIKIANPRIKEAVSSSLGGGMLWPEPLLQLNPTFQPGGTIDDLVGNGTLHAECKKIFRIGKSKDDFVGGPLTLHTHQRDAIAKAKEGKSYVLTSGTGSGKSLTYIVPIVDHVLRNGTGKGIQAIIVYPMNALANSQNEELNKFLGVGYSDANMPVRFARFTGQEKGEEREAIRSNPPDILLTNYMMLELLLTRTEDRELVRKAQGLKFLVFDELHTYRGRQGADVAMLIRRAKLAFNCADAICIGTSATMSSGGNSLEQKQQVARVAQTLFGTSFDATQVIGETLQRSTPEIDFSEAAVRSAIKSAIENSGPVPNDYEAFLSNPLSSWIESTFGITTEADTGILIRKRPSRLKGKGGAAEALAVLSGTKTEDCAQTIQRFLLTGSQLRKSSTSRFPIFAFRLHQFFTRGDTVWSTLEPEHVRHFEMSKTLSKPGEPDKPLFPLVFCRHCGAEYYRVFISDDGANRRVIPREGKTPADASNLTEAYIYTSSTSPWPRGEGAAVVGRVPSYMRETTVEGIERIIPDKKSDLPETVSVDHTGQIVPEGEGIEAALIEKLFVFCLNPTCGVAYAKTQRSERLKLTTLGVDSRSTATTILAVKALVELKSDTALSEEARKLLSFTDNRQDASLQAGHFNDFVQVARLRSALYKALANRGELGLSHADLTRDVFEALQLPFEEYAADPDVRGPAREGTHDALRKVIEYHVYRDLRRGWRVTAPNLEECGLLEFKYNGLHGDDGLLSDKEIWEQGVTVTKGRGEREFLEVPSLIASCPPEVREKLLVGLLDLMRRNLAVKVDCLQYGKQLDFVQQTNPRLQEDTVWYLNELREMEKAEVAYPHPKGTAGQRFGLFVTSKGSFGQFAKRTLRTHLAQGTEIRTNDLDDAIEYLFYALKVYGIIEQVRSEGKGGFQINPASLQWLAGSGEIRPVDRTRLTDVGETPPEVNAYFVNCYKTFLDLNVALEAREHTAQVFAEDREEREDLFRSGRLPLLFCSPTMELGVDISQLNVVNLRNVPPTPANYAQRSGRAGRGGQPALVYTYCAGQSPHDQYYYRHPENMVAGSVVAPRIDLTNRDLLRSHIHAVWMEVAKPDLGKTLMSVIDVIDNDGELSLKVKQSIAETLKNPQYRAQAFEKATKLIDSIREELSTASWFHDDWTKKVLDQIEGEFERSCERWRSLYKTAAKQRALHHKIAGDHSRPQDEREHSKRLRGQAESQLKLLTEAEGTFEGDFYSYRYFASEGFLPGYNFPRLPISGFVPARRRNKGRDNFVSRPRFLAISEFGPRALIYHEGARYRVYKVNLEFGESTAGAAHNLVTNTLKRCNECGYAHFENGATLAEVCDRCGTAFENSARIDGLVQLQNVSLRLAERITCDEEERMRYGYNLVSSYRFPEIGGKQDRKDADVSLNGNPLLKLSYGDSTDLYRVNLGWANRKETEPPGFMLDLERGYWASNAADPEDQEASLSVRQKRVVPYVLDTKNALVISLRDSGLTLEQVAGVQAAFKEAIQKYFQIEPRELSSESMPDPNVRNEILFFESSEGGAGVLKQLVDDPKVIPALAREALKVCHFDPDTLEDLGAETCGKACYECLLDYLNQPDHAFLDRHLIKDFLIQLMKAESRPAGGAGSREDRIAYLKSRCDSQLEKRWLDMVDQLGLRPPSDAQYLIPSYPAQPDFFYKEYNAAVFIDGPHHDEPEQRRKDQVIDEDLSARSYAVVRFHHQDDWEKIFRNHPDIFGG